MHVYTYIYIHMYIYSDHMYIYICIYIDIKYAYIDIKYVYIYKYYGAYIIYRSIIHKWCLSNCCVCSLLVRIANISRPKNPRAPLILNQGCGSGGTPSQVTYGDGICHSLHSFGRFFIMSDLNSSHVEMVPLMNHEI